MGIDHPSVRFVVHWNMPKSMENLYQESGRAGRDGHASHHILMYSWEEYMRFQDLLRLAEEELLAKERSGRPVNRKRVVTLKERLDRLKRVMDWATNPRCRRQTVLKHFGQHITVDYCAKTCDYCSSSHKFEALGPLESHRPAANTYVYKPGEPKYKWQRPQKKGARVDEAKITPPRPMEPVPRYTGTLREDREGLAPNFSLLGGLSAQPHNDEFFDPPRRAAPRPRVERAWRQEFQQRVPAGAKSIGDYIAATESRRTAFLRPWGELESYNTRGREYDETDDIKWPKREDALKASPLSRQRPAKRPRCEGPHEVIVIDSD